MLPCLFYKVLGILEEVLDFFSGYEDILLTMQKMNL